MAALAGLNSESHHGRAERPTAFKLGVPLAPHVSLKVPCRTGSGTAQARCARARTTDSASEPTQALSKRKKAPSPDTSSESCPERAVGHRAFEIGVHLAPYAPLKVPCRTRTGTAHARRETARATGCVSRLPEARQSGSGPGIALSQGREGPVSAPTEQNRRTSREERSSPLGWWQK